MSGNDPRKPGDDQSLEAELNKQAEEASEAVRKRAGEVLEVSNEQAGEAGEAVRRDIKERAKRLAGELLSETSRSDEQGRDAGPDRAKKDEPRSKAAAKKKTGKKTSGKAKKKSGPGERKKKASKKRGKSR